MTRSRIPLPESLWTEADYGQQVADAGRQMGLICYHTRTGRSKKGWTTPHTVAGWPDWEFYGDHRCHFMAELKGRKTIVTPEQVACHARLRAMGHTVYLWRLGANPLDEIANIFMEEIRAARAEANIFLEQIRAGREAARHPVTPPR